MPESTHYPLAEAATAIRVMGAAEHTGKLVLDIPHAGRSSVVLPPEQAQVFRATAPTSSPAAWVASGLFLAEKMASGGLPAGSCSARRSQPTQKALETIELVRAIGSDIVVECGDIAEAGHRGTAGGGGDRRPGFRCAACCTRPPWSRTPPCPTSPTS